MEKLGGVFSFISHTWYIRVHRSFYIDISYVIFQWMNSEKFIKKNGNFLIDNFKS